MHHKTNYEFLASSSSQNAGPSVTEIANNPILWVLACSVLLVIVLQSAIYMRAVRQNAEAADMTQAEVSKAFRAGSVAAIGPSLAVVLVAIALLPLFGTPPVLVRIGLIGSAATEVASASVAAGTTGAELGGEGYDANTFVIALAAMSISGAGWMIATLILTPIFQKSEAKMQRVNPALMTIVPSAALLAAFASLAVTEVPKSNVHFVTVITSAAVMGLCLWISKALNQAWLREWGLGISMFVGLAVAYFAHYNGLNG